MFTKMATLSDSSTQTRWRTIFGNNFYLANDGSERWTTRIVSSGNFYLLKYSFVDINGEAGGWWWDWYNNPSCELDQVLEFSNGSSPDDCDKTQYTTNINSYASILKRSYTGDWTFWLSDTGSGAWLLLEGRTIIGAWLGADNVWLWGKREWNAGETRGYGQPYWLGEEGGKIWRWMGPPATSNPNLEIVAPDVYKKSNAIGNVNNIDEYYFTSMAMGSNQLNDYDNYGNGPATFTTSGNDIAFHYPAGNGISLNAGDYLGTETVQFDGVNYWLRTGANFSQYAFVFNLGPTDPGI